MEEKVSVIIPIYQVEAYLSRCVSSVLAQTYPYLEVILVDDGGTDGCPALCDAFAAQDERVVCLHSPNVGSALARKAGAEASTGRYLLFVDGDDWLVPNAVEAALSAAETYEADVVCFGYQRIYPHRTFETPLFLTDQAVLPLEPAVLRRRMVGLLDTELQHVETADRLSPMWGKLYRRELVAQGRWISERQVGSSEDALFNFFALAQCKKCVYVNQTLYCYRKTNGSAQTRRYRPQLSAQWEVLFGYFQDAIQQERLGPEFQEALHNRMVVSMLGLGLNEQGAPASFRERAARLREILARPPWRDVYRALSLKPFSPRWKVFFWLCKRRHTGTLLLMLSAVDRLKSLLPQ